MIDLDLRVANVLGDLLAKLRIDSLDEMALLSDAHARGRLGLAPTEGGEVDATLHKLGAEDVAHLTGNEVGRRLNREHSLALCERERGARSLEVIALRYLSCRLLVGVVDLLHVDG